MQIVLDKQVEKCIRSLQKSTIAKVLRTIDLLEQFGNQLGLPHSKKMAVKLFELRIRGQQEVRIFYYFDNNKAVLLHAFIKKSQKTPNKELKLAQRKINDLT